MLQDTQLLTDWLKESARHYKKTKAFSKKARAYYEGDQLDKLVKNILANRGQPEQYENQIAKHNNAILGFKQERKAEIKLFGRQEEDKGSALMLNAVIKAITQVSDYEVESNELDNELSIEGVAISEFTVSTDGEMDSYGREHKDVEIKQIPSSEIYLDPFSSAKNYNDDARYITRAFWVDVDDMYSLGFDAKKIKDVTNTNFLSSIIEDDLYADTSIRKRALLCYTWYREYDKEEKKDKFYYAFWSNDVILLQNESPFDFAGFPYEVEFLNRSKNKHAEIKYWGLYRDIMPLQDSINYAKLRLGNMLGNNKMLINRKALMEEDIEGFNDEWSMDNAVVMVEDINGIKDVRQNAQIQQILNTIIDSRNQISELLNSNKEMLGTANNRMSGVGQEQRIQTGLVGLARFMNASDRLQKRIIKKLVKFVSQYYDTERVISIVDDDYVQDYITINQTVRNADGMLDYEVLEDGSVKPIANNTIKIGKYDLIYTAKPKSSSMSTERLRQNVELMKILQSTDPTLVKYIIPDILKDSESPSAEKIRKIIESQTQQQQNSPQAHAAQQLQAENEALNKQLKASQARLNDAKAQGIINKNKIDLQKAFSNALIAKQNLQTKQDKNQLDAMRRIR